MASREGALRPTVGLWRGRHAATGPAGRPAAARLGPPDIHGQGSVRSGVVDGSAAVPEVTHVWSRLPAEHLGVVDATVAGCFHEYLVQSWRQATFKFSTNPALSPAECLLWRSNQQRMWRLRRQTRNENSRPC